MDITLPSGKVINAHAGIVGIDANGAVFEGYDGRIFDPDYGDPFDSEPALTPVERVELADLMLARWMAFKSRAILDHDVIPLSDYSYLPPLTPIDDKNKI